MKTAIIKTDFWKEDRIFELLPDARYFYLCLLTNPERNATPAFKCSDRLLIAYTGYNIDTIAICKKELVSKNFIKIIENHYIINNQDYVTLKKGKLSSQLYTKEFSLLPLKVQELLMSDSGATQERNSISKSNSKEISKSKEVDEVSKAYYETIKELQLPVRNHTHLKGRIKKLEQEVGKNKALEYLDFIKNLYNKLEADEFKPSLNEGLDIYAKRVAIQTWVEKKNNSSNMTVI